ncbi:MAG: universal stress protein [Candidatus Xenobia bacterium]
MAHSIVERARRAGANLIVTGTAGRRGLSRLLVGSTAEGVLRLAECPVMTVRSGIPAIAIH